jgi:hypothetical protein
VPGDPADSEGTQIIIDKDDGVLVVAEAGYYMLGQGHQDQASMKARSAAGASAGWPELPTF